MSIETIALLCFANLLVIIMSVTIFSLSRAYTKSQRIAELCLWIGIVSLFSLSMIGVHELGAM